MALAFHVDYTQGNPAANIRVDVETIEQAGEVIVAIVKEAAFSHEILGAFAISAM